MFRKKIIFFVVILLFSLLFFVVLFSFNQKNIDKIEFSDLSSKKVTEITVMGDSLSPLIKNNEKVKIQLDYYGSSTNILSNDIISYDYAGSKLPILKIIKATPGDSWGIRKNNNIYNIVVNGKVLVNSENKEYEIPENKIAMLQLYADTYPVIPPDSCLILGDKVDGTLDSTVFGLVHKADFIGRVER